MTSIGDRLKLLRQFLKLTQKDLAEVLEIKQPTIVSIEKGQTKLSVEQLYKLQELYKASSNWLITGKGEMFVDYDQNMSDINNEFEKIMKTIEGFLNKYKSGKVIINEDNLQKARFYEYLLQSFSKGN